VTIKIAAHLYEMKLQNTGGAVRQATVNGTRSSLKFCKVARAGHATASELA
jgi:hypothetical protein